MQLLMLLTLVYAAVLVLALAVSLILIWLHLKRIGAVLGQARGELEAVRDSTSALGRLLEPASGAPEGIADTLAQANRGLRNAGERLDAATGHAVARHQ